MSLRVMIRPEAEADILEAAQWYRQQCLGLEIDFVDEVRSAIDRAAENPQAWRFMRRSPHIRRILAERFPYRIFYIVEKDTVIVFAVIHGKRHDRAWRDRL